MKKVFLIVGLGLTLCAQAQNYLHQVLILNEGYFDYNLNQILTPVTVGSYNPATQTYQEVSTINNMRFASDLIIDGNAYYVAADSKILKYDLNAHSLIAEVNCPGVRNLGYEWGNEKGIVGALDLTTLTYGNEIDLGPDGKNPDNLMVYNGKLYTVNNKDWSGSSVSEISLVSGVANTVNLSNAGTGCGTSALRDDKLVYQISMETTLNEFDMSVMNTTGPVVGHQTNYYELAQEPVSGNFYCSETDFFSYGTVHIFDGNNTEITQFAVSTSPGTVVFDVRSNVGLTEIHDGLAVYPNPANDVVTVDHVGEKLVYALDGTLLLSSNEQKLNISSLAPGMYVIAVNGQKTTIVKQ